jgi:hypothetical protein
MTNKRFLMSALLAAALTPATVFAQASSSVETRKIPITLDQLNPCNGETVVITGTIDIATRTTIDANGRTHIAFNDVPHLKGEGSTGGYKVAGVTREHDTFEVADSDWPMTQSFTQRYHIISQGKAPNYIDDYAISYSVDASGNTEVRFEHASARCVGD